jgi:REP-associated tyrosine transposase
MCADRGRRLAHASTGGYVRRMPRPLRTQFAGGTYHVTCRGNRKQPIFLEPDDNRFHLWCLEQASMRFEWRILTWVHMTNHFHMVVLTPQATLSKGMHWVNGLYAQVFNERHDLTGHLFQGRFHSTVIEDESQLLACVRYDDMNPVRAGLCDHPLAWRWSSCRALAGLEPPRFLDTEYLLRHFSADRWTAERQYLEFVEAGLPEPWPQAA